MDADVSAAGARLTRRVISDAVGDLGWRFVLGALCTTVGVNAVRQAAEVATAIARVAGDADNIGLDLRRDGVILTLQDPATATVTQREIDVAATISAVVQDLGLRADPHTEGIRPVQLIEIAIDAMDIAAVRPFWKAVMGYADEPGHSGPEDPVVDPLGQGPAIWFQQMDAPRPQRNRIHFDISVPHDQAATRIDEALTAGGVLVSDAEAPAFWVLADAEGNEACVTTWQGRD